MIKIWGRKSRTRKNDKYAAPDAKDWQQVIGKVIKIQKVIIKNNNIYSNISDETISPGQPLILDSNIKVANPLTSKVIGISVVNCSPGKDCIYITQGHLSLKNWYCITGFDELIPGADYYLSMSVKGQLTNIAPNLVDNAVVQVGCAQDKNTLAINIKTPIYL